MDELNAFIPVPIAPRQIAPERRAEWHQLMLEQHGVLSWAQAISLGITPQGIASQIAAHRWRRVLHSVYAAFTGPLTRPARLTAALLYAGAPAMLSHVTAAEEWGMCPLRDDEPVHVTVPYGRNAVSHPPAVMLHRSRAFDVIASADTPQPRSSRADTIIDLATSEPTAAEARLTFVHLAGSSPVSMTSLARQLLCRPPFRYRAVLNHALELVRGGSLSALEAEYTMAVERAHGLPTGARQQPFHVDGRVLWEDVGYDNAGARLTVRLDGRATHSTPGIAFRDRRRDNAAELADRRRLTYGWTEVSADPCSVAAEVIAVLRRDGWRGIPHPCRSAHCALLTEHQPAS